jgi:hypothetical protein
MLAQGVNWEVGAELELVTAWLVASPVAWLAASSAGSAKRAAR